MDNGDKEKNIPELVHVNMILPSGTGTKLSKSYQNNINISYVYVSAIAMIITNTNTLIFSNIISLHRWDVCIYSSPLHLLATWFNFTPSMDK